MHQAKRRTTDRLDAVYRLGAVTSHSRRAYSRPKTNRVRELSSSYFWSVKKLGGGRNDVGELAQRFREERFWILGFHARAKAEDVE